MPSRVYAGQNLKIPVSNGTTPIQPQMPITPEAANAMSVRPAMMRKIRSMLPTLVFI